MSLAATLLLAVQVATGTLGPPAGPPREPVSAESSAAANRIVELAAREVTQDTAYPKEIVAALDDTRTYVRANAFSSVSIVLSGLRNGSDSRALTRYQNLKSLLRPLVMTGLRDRDGVVRRYAFLALTTIDLGTPDMGATTALAERLFTADPEPTVRQMALDLLLQENRSRSRRWQLIEEGLNDRSPTVKASAIREAANSGEAEALPYLLRALNDDSDQWSRLSAAGGLQRFIVTNPEVVDALAARHAAESNAYVKEQMGHVLAQMRARKQ